mmetsp:Transcript_10998/g.50925  ORF Transcript_10998/g.50925 Transcript_10998/m.50925 type:complete len:231 (-) Transcript_10998:655-1347(-)
MIAWLTWLPGTRPLHRGTRPLHSDACCLRPRVCDVPIWDLGWWAQPPRLVRFGRQREEGVVDAALHVQLNHTARARGGSSDLEPEAGRGVHRPTGDVPGTGPSRVRQQGAVRVVRCRVFRHRLRTHSRSPIGPFHGGEGGGARAVVADDGGHGGRGRQLRRDREDDSSTSRAYHQPDGAQAHPGKRVRLCGVHQGRVQGFHGPGQVPSSPRRVADRRRRRRPRGHQGAAS